MIFVYLIIGVIILSAILAALGVGVTEEVFVPAPKEVTAEDVGAPAAQIYAPYEPIEVSVPNSSIDFVLEEVTIPIRSLLSVDGIRFLFTSFVSNFAGFSVVSVIFVAMIGVGVAEEAGMMGALIRKLVAVAPGSLLTFIIILIGGLSSVATDAGYLILIPSRPPPFSA